MPEQSGPTGLTDRGRLFLALYESMAEGVALHEVVYDAAGQPRDYRILDINPAYTTHTGITREMVVGRTSLEAYGVEPPPYMEEFMTAGHHGRLLRFETYFAPLERHFSISVAPTGPGYFATIFTDITEQKRLEELRRQTERKFAQVFDLAPNPIAVSDVEGTLLSVNRAYCEFVGWSKEELQGRNVSDFGLWVDPAQRQQVVQRLKLEGRFSGVTIEVRTRSGQVRTVEFSGALIELDGRQVLVSAANDM